MLEMGLGVDDVSVNGERERGVLVEHVVLLSPMRPFGESVSPKLEFVEEIAADEQMGETYLMK